MQPSTLHFAALCQSLQKLETLSSAPGNTAASRTLLRRLIAAARASGDLYAVARLLIPKRDLERQHYNMKESALAAILTEALGLAADSKDGILLSNWKRTDNAAAGDFARIASEVTGKRQFRKICQLSISDFNLLLDRLAATSGRKERVAIFMELIEKTTAKEIKWVVRFILKDVKIGLGENSILDVIHQDAKAMMATCIDLKRVCMQLHNPSARFVLQELVLGKVVKSQHSKRMNSIELTWEAMKRKDVVVECKFDGDRMQVHKDGTRLWFWSRNGKEHQEYSIPLGEALRHSIISDRCVLDGELLVLDRFENRFKPRTKTLNHDAARAARKGLETDDLVCYMIFDILYEGEQGSVLHYPLRKRRELLKTVIQPGFSPQVFCTATENSKWSLIPACQEELTDFFLRTIEMGDEGIVVKDLDSKWSPDNRDGRWCKIKPDYVSMGSDLDLLIIGGYYGTGSHGGKIVSFLLALVDEIEGCASSRFVSICRCGRGLPDEELALLQNKISPYIVKNNKGGKPPATCGYLVTNNRYECPDIWILKPEMSIVLQISSERRIYRTQTFKAGWTFRFQRIVKNLKKW